MRGRFRKPACDGMVARMSIRPALAAAVAALAIVSSPAIAADPPAGRVAPSAIVEQAPAADWTAIAPDDLMVMTLAPASPGGPVRRVVIQLLPAPLSAPWVANIRRLATAHWWDGTSINRVQDNYVAQWGDATEKKPLPPGLSVVSEANYDLAWTSLPGAGAMRYDPIGGYAPRGSADGAMRPVDVYAPGLIWYRGFPLGSELKPAAEGRRVWPVHCYGMVGVGRNLSPDTGSGAELYAVIGHAPRHLDRNIALAGRVIEGIEHLSSLPRGTGALGFYEKPEQRVAITSVRLATDLPDAERPRFAYLSTEGTTWPRYVEARRNREPPFFNRPADAADMCNIPVPIKRLP